MADNILREIDEALRADRASAFWNKHRSAIITFVVVLILATAGHNLWQKYQQSQGAKLFQALSDQQKLLEAGKASEAAQGFGTIANDASGEHKDLALVWQSRALVAAGKKDEAIAALKTVVSGSMTTVWHDIACLRLAGLDAAAASPCLAANTKSPLAALRSEWAIAGNWAKGDRQAAVTSLETLMADPATSQETRARLAQWLSVIKAQKE